MPRAACAAKSSTAFPDEAGALHLLGLIAHRDGDWANARDLLRRSTESPDASALYLLTYADLFCKTTDRAAALALARRATDLDSALPLGWCYLGHLLLEMRQLEESRRCLQRAIDLDPHFWQARTHLAVAAGAGGRCGRANAQFERLHGRAARQCGNHRQFCRLLGGAGSLRGCAPRSATRHREAAGKARSPCARRRNRNAAGPAQDGAGAPRRRGTRLAARDQPGDAESAFAPGG